MRKLKLQMQITVDGFVGGPNGELDWATWNWDEQLNAHVTALTEGVDMIVMGRKLAEGFIPYWAGELNKPQTEQTAGAEQMALTPKVVFSKTLTASPWEHAEVNGGDLADEIKKLKEQEGGDIIAYGGATFVTGLIATGLIDELHLLVNPTAIGSGMRIFGERTDMELVAATAFPCGIVDMHYRLVG